MSQLSLGKWNISAIFSLIEYFFLVVAFRLQIVLAQMVVLAGAGTLFNHTKQWRDRAFESQ